MRPMRFAALAAAILAMPTLAAADEAAGVQILIDMQDPQQIAKTFCVHASKLYSVDAQTCVSGSVLMKCSLVDPNDSSKGVKWVVTDEKARCRP